MTSHRIIKDLQWAIPCPRPKCIPRGRPRGSKKQGLLYEQKLAEELGGAWTHGAWYEFEDRHGHGYCQVDFVRRTADVTVVLEAKLTWLPEAHTQIEWLYKPILEACFHKPVVGVVIARRLVPGITAAIAHTLPSALEAARSCSKIVLHWSGKTSLYPGPRTGLSAIVPLSTVTGHSTLQ